MIYVEGQQQRQGLFSHRAEARLACFFLPPRTRLEGL